MRLNVGRFTSFSTEIESFPKIFLYSMKIKVQTRKLAAGCSKHCFEVVDRTDEVNSKHGFEVVDETDEVSNHIYGKATLTWFEEIFEEY
ncbi:N-ethylammeline chlorohydrolase [Streptococcus pneumoniae]|nr:N-ethylammeline chlorohydrolase [Streptococcus pneumoniae]CEY03954.1 N-ethylammeline chlorohydrolase [Streptococcus pneumoniae]CGG98078.1 N-ethylammeline chlorohydrolase [Streptococcus pneumoniae]CIP95049.1 N-ethylammeline chlorohydrolase [Streptococcus pneumoniae]CIQ48375.1 N-ethylammeline chlorohydrolase [Streptococcus pneumoniae]